MVSISSISSIRTNYNSKNIYTSKPVNKAQKFCGLQANAFKNDEQSNNKSYLIPALFTLGGIGLAIACKGKFSSSAPKAASSATSSITQNSAIPEAFPKDKTYREILVKALNLPIEEAKKIRSIIGTEELTHWVRGFSQNPKVYSPGTIAYTPSGKAFVQEIENVKSFEFGANLHMHTVHSDGRMTIPEMLTQAAQYGDKRFAKTGKPFVFAITDHDSVGGCIEAINIIRKEPEKYKNIRLVLGIENSTFAEHPAFDKPVYIHLLSYGVNPFSKDMDTFLLTRVRKNQDAIKNAISSVTQKHANGLNEASVQYSFDEFAASYPAAKSSLKPSRYLLKDYLQFKVIHKTMIEDNTRLSIYLQENNIPKKEIALTAPVALIPHKVDFSHGQHYYDYYYDALKKVVAREYPTIDKEKLPALMPPLPDKTKNLLNDIESDVLNPSSTSFVKEPEFVPFATAVSKLSQMDGVSLGIAHPGVYFPRDAAKDASKIPDFYESLYEQFVNLGNGKSLFSENHYQVYYKDKTSSFLSRLDGIREKYGLLQTGSLDTHESKIYLGG